jgi:hypothetical protein
LKKGINHLVGQHSEIGQQEAHCDVSMFKVPTMKLLSPTTSIFHFQEHNAIGKQEAVDDVQKFMVPKKKLLALTSFVA